MKKHRRQRLPVQAITTEVEKLSHDCRGIARIDGKTTFIQGALANETIEFQITNEKRDFNEGKLLCVLKPSPQRIEAKCPHYAICGGCSLQHLNGEEQIRQKQDILLDLLQRLGKSSPEQVLKPLTANSWNYRNKARLSVRYIESKQACLIGFRERSNPRNIAEINQCPVLHGKVDNDLPQLSLLVNSLQDKKAIAHIEVAASDTEVALILRNLSLLSAVDEEKIRGFAEKYKYKIFLQPAGEESIYCFHPKNANPFLSYELPKWNITLSFHPADFIQVNPAMNRLMVERALELIQPDKEDQILDLFCGLGNFSLPLARLCAKVIGVEGSQTMVERARRNADLNQLANTEFYSANLEDEQQVKAIFKHSFNKLLIDPPRSGAFAVVKALRKIKLEKIVYVSCNPVTLARDALVLREQGYCLKAAGVMDMFPHTAHVESIALFERS